MRRLLLAAIFLSAAAVSAQPRPPLTRALADSLYLKLTGGTVANLTVTGTCTGCASGAVPTTRLVSTTSPLGGGGDLSADRTLTCTLCLTSGGALGTPSSGTGTNITGILESGVTNLTADLAAKLAAASNLSDLANAGTARTNLGLGTLATQSGTFSGTSSGTNTGDQVVPTNTTSTSSQWFAAYNSSTGVFTKSQPAFSDISGSFILAQFPTIATNTVLGNATAGTAVPTALAIGTCSTAGSAVIWTTNTGFGCNTSITANTATTATTATNATNTAITDDTATNAEMPLTWVTTNTGNLPQKVTSTKATLNPSTGTVTHTVSNTGGIIIASSNAPVLYLTSTAATSRNFALTNQYIANNLFTILRSTANNGISYTEAFSIDGTNGAASVTGALSVTGIITASSQAVTAGTMTVTNSANVRKVIQRFDWTNAMVTALGATTAGDVAVCTLPAKTVVTNVYVVIDTADSSSNALTVAVGRTSAAYIDYIVASDAKAAANTVYGDASGERGTNLTGYDLPSITGTTVVNAHFIKTTTNLSTVTASTGHIYIETMTLP